MEFHYAIAEKPALTASIALRAVFCLGADYSYDVKKRGVPNRDVVALRTVGGQGKITIEGVPEEITVEPGTLLFFAHTKVRRYHCSGARWDFWWFEFGFGELLDLPMNRLMTLEAIDSEAQDCEECLALLRRAEPNSAALASAAFALLLQRWLHALEADAQKSAGGYAVARSIQHMKATLGSAVSVEELAQLSGLSSRRFRQVFQAATGSSPKRYLDALRISTAESLLINTPFAIHEIANRLGYSSPFHFCKAFQKVHGIPPSQFRRNPLASRAAQTETSSDQR